LSGNGNHTNGFDAEIIEMMGALPAGNDAAVAAWTRACEVYARYYNALARSEDEADVLAANHDFLAEVLNLAPGSHPDPHKLNGSLKTPT